MSRKKKVVDRCNVCGSKATEYVAGDLHVCNNEVCLGITLAKIKAAVDTQQLNGRNDE